MQLDVQPNGSWVSRIADLWTARLVENPNLGMCLATGTTPVPVYAEMGRRVATGAVSFAEATVFVLDEWLGLPPGHEVRCDSMLQRDLVAHVDLDPERVHTFDVDHGDPEAVCRSYDAAISEHGGLDLAIVGLGRNGHLGMNEPGAPFDAPTRIVELAEETRQGASRYGELIVPPTHGVTVGLGPIGDAGEVWLLVSGAGKAEIVSRVLTEPVGPDLPATKLRRHPRSVVFADGDAAGALGTDLDLP